MALPKSEIQVSGTHDPSLCASQLRLMYCILLMILFFSYYSEMFMDTNKFSTKTLSAINNLEGAVIRKKQDYNWRKEMEE